jgi:hypothetical protein
VLDVIASDEHKAPAAIDRCSIDDSETRLAPARRATAETLAAESAHNPQRQCQQAKHHDEGEQHFESILSPAE